MKDLQTGTLALSAVVKDDLSDIDDAIAAYSGPAAPPIPSFLGTKSGRRRAAYVVTNGRRLGVFVSWDEANASTSGYPHCRLTGYSTVEEAEAAWACALNAGCIGPPGNSQQQHNPASTSLPVESSPIPARSQVDTKHITSDQSSWVVIRGRKPGVYIGRENSFSGIGDAVGGIVLQASSISDAYRTFVEQYMAGNIYVLPPPLS